jgi:hypothetical protein
VIGAVSLLTAAAYVAAGIFCFSLPVALVAGAILSGRPTDTAMDRLRAMDDGGGER